MISHGYWLSLKGQREGDVQGTAQIGSGFESPYGDCERPVPKYSLWILGD